MYKHLINKSANKCLVVTNKPTEIKCLYKIYFNSFNSKDIKEHITNDANILVELHRRNIKKDFENTLFLLENIEYVDKIGNIIFYDKNENLVSFVNKNKSGYQCFVNVDKNSDINFNNDVKEKINQIFIYFPVGIIFTYLSIKVLSFT